MKNPTPCLLALSAAIVLLANAPPYARACDACSGNQEIKLPDTADGILKSLYEHDTALRDLVAAKKLNRVSFIAINMRVLAKALPAKAASEKKAAVEESVKDFIAILKDLGRAALREDQRGTAFHLAKVAEKFKALDGQFNYRPTAVTTRGASGSTNHFQQSAHNAPARSAAPSVVPRVERQQTKQK